MSNLTQVSEVLTALEVAVDTYESVMADGKIDFKDAAELPELFMAVRTAVAGAGEISGEISDASSEELAVELARAIKLIKKVLLKF